MKKDFFAPTRAIYSHCGTGACMNILNYFWDTTFGSKDTLDVETMIRFGYFDWNGRPSEMEILLFLAQMGFDIEIYTQFLGQYDLLVRDPIAHATYFGYEPYPLVSTDRNRIAVEKILNHSNVKFIEDETLNLPEIMRKKSDGDYLFLIGLDGYKIHNREKPEGEHGGHIMMSTGYISTESDLIRLYETSPASMIDRTVREIANAQDIDE